MGCLLAVRTSAALLALVVVAGCAGSGGEQQAVGGTGAPSSAGAYQTVATGLEAPWDMAFLPDGSALLTERPGRIRLMSSAGRFQDRPIAEMPVAQTFPPAQQGVALTTGLLGVAVDPEFEANRYVYFYRAMREAHQVVRYRYANGRLSDETVVVNGIPAAEDHAGGRTRFGPDGWLYITTGYLMDESAPQNPRALPGKVLRLSPAAARGRGGQPEIFASGFRNPQGLAWEPGTGRLLVTDHGSNSNDELNLVRRGANYGWPLVEGTRSRPGLTEPLALWPQTIAPSGLTYVRNPRSAWAGSFLIGTLRGEHLRRITLDGDRVVTNEPVPLTESGRIRIAVEAPDGSLYLLTTNRNLGSPREGDDQVVRLRMFKPAR